MSPVLRLQTVENFTTHARNGYYDNIVFHRVIKGFMLQTGDPLGMFVVMQRIHRAGLVLQNGNEVARWLRRCILLT